MGSTRDLQEGLLLELAPHLAIHGFERRRKEQSFSRRTDFGRQTFHISFIKHADDCDVTADVAVRIDALEELLIENSALANGEKGKTHSLGAELGNIHEGKQRRWTLRVREDIPRVSTSMMSAFEAIGLPYRETHSDLNQALAALSADGRASWLHSPFHDLRAMRAIGLAYILGRIDQLDSLIAAKTRFLRDRNDPSLDAFLDFARKIKNRITGAPLAPTRTGSSGAER